MASTTVTYTRQQKKLTVHFGQTYFGWPAQRQALTSYIREKISDAEVYVCPSLFEKLRHSGWTWWAVTLSGQILTVELPSHGENYLSLILS